MIVPSAQLWFFFQSYWSPVYLFLPLWINFYSSQYVATTTVMAALRNSSKNDQEFPGAGQHGR
jgi:hypothetical protein